MSLARMSQRGSRQICRHPPDQMRSSGLKGNVTSIPRRVYSTSIWRALSSLVNRIYLAHTELLDRKLRRNQVAISSLSAGRCASNTHFFLEVQGPIGSSAWPDYTDVDDTLGSRAIYSFQLLGPTQTVIEMPIPSHRPTWRRL